MFPRNISLIRLCPSASRHPCAQQTATQFLWLFAQLIPPPKSVRRGRSAHIRGNNVLPPAKCAKNACKKSKGQEPDELLLKKKTKQETINNELGLCTSTHSSAQVVPIETNNLNQVYVNALKRAIISCATQNLMLITTTKNAMSVPIVTSA